MNKPIDWLPKRDADFYNKQHKYVAQVSTNKLVYKIADTAITALTDAQAIYEPLFEAIEDKKDRTSADVAAHRTGRKVYEKVLRAFNKEYVLNNSNIPDADKVILIGKERDTEPTPHPVIEDVPIVGNKVLGGGQIEFKVRAYTDQTRPSMLRAANMIDYCYILLDVGEMPPAKVADCNKSGNESRAKFVLKVGDENQGKKLYIYFRWVNNRKPRQEGPWSNFQSIIVG